MSLRRQQRKRMLHQAAQRWADAELPGLDPRKVIEILQFEADRPMRGGNAEPSHTSIFGDSHKQKELF